MDWALFSYGRQEMAGDMRIVVTVTGTQTVYTHCQSVLLQITASHHGTQRAVPQLWPLHSVAERTERREL